MKILIILVLGYFLLAPLWGGSYLPRWWSNPHAHFLGIKQPNFFKSESKVKPDLSLIKANLYMPFEAFIGGSKYRGLIVIKPDEKGSVKVNGAVFQGQNTQAMSLLDGELVDKKTFYQIKLKTKNASQLFKSNVHYQTATEFPTDLEIRSYGDKNTMYIINPIESAETQTIRFLPYQIDIEKPYLGKWESSTYDGSWEFEFSKLPGSQLTGIAYFKNGDQKCGYPMFAFPIGRQQLMFMTGEGTPDATQCKIHSWTSNPGDGSYLELMPYQSDGYQIHLSKK